MTNGLELLLKWEQHDARLLSLYADRAATRPRFDLAGDLLTDPSARGAESTQALYIERYLHGLTAYMAGVRFNDAQRKSLGLRVIDAGVAAQQADGSWPCGDVHHSAAFFLEAVGRLVLLADMIGLKDVERYRRCLRQGAHWFQRPSSWNDNDWRDSMHHRFFLNSAVLFLEAEALDDTATQIVDQAYAWLGEGVRRQDPDGAITELGGHDTGYHSLAVTFMADSLLACRTNRRAAPQLQRRLMPCFEKAVRWLRNRVGDSGDIDATGNTRMSPTSVETNRNTGQPKDMEPHMAASALVGAGLVLDDASYLRTAEKILAAGGY